MLLMFIVVMFSVCLVIARLMYSFVVRGLEMCLFIVVAAGFVVIGLVMMFL